MYEGIDNGELFNAWEERSEIDTHLGTPIDTTLCNGTHTTIGRLAGITAIGSCDTYCLCDIAREIVGTSGDVFIHILGIERIEQHVDIIVF